MKKKLTEEECKNLFEQKLKDLHEDLGDENTNFVETFSMNFSRSPDLTGDYEQEFLTLALEGVTEAKEIMLKNKILIERPPDMFAEMVRTDEELQRIRDSLDEQRQKKEKILSRKQQSRELKEKPKKQNKQKRPGMVMKKDVSKKQQKRDKQRQRQRQL
ncbi:putative rRNA-processing protein EBP2 [Histomonas meleagridis]|uniref:putative rRNA-processing protein EBP2-like n=1 Tax=Histomonas meleagridis TaxID=135588 RepID=UPI00355A03D5|nr:putative rRNA-processing protein EBP2 [Histomonas meleagridis]KAH0805760.1 putative rRNA-processing protein EBP2-like [Histomonas meleagridis]